MNFKKYHVSRNLLPSPVSATVESAGITIESTGDGTINASGTRTSGDSPTINLKEAVTLNGTYYVHLRNNVAAPSSTIVLRNGTTSIVNITLTSTNLITQITLSNVTIDNIQVYVTPGTSINAQMAISIEQTESVTPYEPYSSEVWHDSHYIMGTSTDTITTLPVDIYADGNNATVSLKGNTTQSGTPTPESPIMPQGCGERTENLYDYSTIVPGYTYNSNGQMILNPDEANRWRYAAVPLIEVESGATYRRTYDLLPWGNTINFYDSNKNFLERATPGSGMPVTVPSNCKFVSFVFQTANSDVKKYMFTRGSTVPSEFIPFGYKIPISSAGQTTPVYLGEVESTRRIKKLVLTGEENITSGHLDVGLFNIPIDDYIREPIISLICTHYIAQSNVAEWGRVSNKNICFYVGSTVEFRQLYIRDSSYSTIADFKAYLAQQYAAGTPVTVWYTLATPTTGIVNEPLMKIGDYADTVSGITIPTITSKDTFDVDTTLKPSEVSLSYTGWHPVQSVHEAVQSNNLFNPEHHITIENLDYIGDVYPANKYRVNNVSNFPCYYKIGESGTTATINLPANIYLNASDVVYIWCSVNSNRKIGVTEGSTPLPYEPYGIIWNP